MIAEKKLQWIWGIKGTMLNTKAVSWNIEKHHRTKQKVKRHGYYTSRGLMSVHKGQGDNQSMKIVSPSWPKTSHQAERAPPAFRWMNGKQPNAVNTASPTLPFTPKGLCNVAIPCTSETEDGHVAQWQENQTINENTLLLVLALGQLVWLCRMCNVFCPSPLEEGDSHRHTFSQLSPAVLTIICMQIIYQARRAVQT